MAKNLCIFSLSLAVIFLSGCVYIANFDDAMFMKSLEDSQNEMQAELDKEKSLYNKLKTDIDKGRLHKSMLKRNVFSIYGEAPLCKPPEVKFDIKETCFYRDPAEGGLFAQMILLNFDGKDRLSSWEIQNPGK